MCLLIWTVFTGQRCGPWATCSILFHAKVWQTCFHYLICIENKRIYFQLLMKFQSMGNEMNCYNKPNSEAQNHRTVSKLVCRFFFQISFWIFLLFFFCSCQPQVEKKFQFFLQFAIKNCIASFKFLSPNNIKIPPETWRWRLIPDWLTLIW